MNQNTCKTCKWWGWDRGDLRQIPTQNQWKCRGPHVKDRDLEGMVDCEDFGGVFTGPDFGCIHYEETKEQLPQNHPGYATQQIKLAARFGAAGSEQSIYQFEEMYRLGTPPHCDHVYDSAICAGGDWYYICSKCGRRKFPDAAMA